MGEMNRREMVGATSAMAAMGAMALAAREGRAAKPDGKMGYAIVGLGYYAVNVIMPRFKDCEHSKLVAVVSGDPEKAKRIAGEYGLSSKGIYSYANYDSIRNNPEIDIVYICLPNSMHAEYTIRGAKAGKHVMCEKPMAVSSAECEAMIAACKVAGKKLMIGYRSHFEPTNLEARRLANTGAIGTRRYFRSEHGFVQGDPAKWRLKKALSGGGSLMDIGIYALQAARYMTGEEPVAVYAHESTDKTDPRFNEVEDRIEFELEFPSGVIGSCMSMYSANRNQLLLMGDKGRIEMEPATRYEGNKLWIGKDGREDAIDPPKGPGANQFAAQLDHLPLCIAQNKDPIVGGDEGLRDLRIIEAIYRSAREQKRVTL
jgi:predicted dehydrogenase